MSVIQKNFYSNSDVSIIDLMNTTDSTFKGRHQVSLTNYDNTSLPAIAIGSIVENNGSLFEFTSETAISGSPSDGSVYIYLVPSGDPALGTAIITPTFSNVAPTWSDSKQGWYGTGGSANYRYLEYKMTKASSNYKDKRSISNDNAGYFISYVMTSSGSVSLTANSAITLLFDSKIYDKLTDYSPSTGIFTAPKTGYYEINMSFSIFPETTTVLRSYSVLLELYKISTKIHSAFTSMYKPTTTASITKRIYVSDNTILLLNSGETLYYTLTLGVSDTNSATIAENGTVSTGSTVTPNMNIKYLGV